MGVPINNVTRRVVYAASGTGPYAFTFEILAATDIAVYRDDTLLTLTTDYTVTIAGNGTGSITLTAAPTGATQIAIVGNRTIQRTTDFVTGGDFFANTLNDELDQQTIFAQQNAEGLQRALQAPQTDPTSINMTLPGRTARANKTLSFDANGNPTPGVSAADVANAVTYATNAANSATAAAASASAASSSASSASSSASTATTQASNASTSATNAANSASAASTSATNAASSASTAATQASNASTSATNAASSASAASTSASNAATSATNASNSASAAATSASNAATSETNAANSASAAAASAASAANTFDSFDDRYLGTKASNPTVDNDGNALVAGALYFSTSENIMKVYDGASWIAATSAGNVSFLRFRYVATAGQTTFSGADSNAATLSYTVNNIVVFLNGVALDQTEYTATSGTSVVLGTGAALNDELVIVAFKSFVTADMVPASTGGTYAGNITYSPGTANGVMYLNGSKVMTAGSALTFDGTTFELTRSQNTDTVIQITNSNSGTGAVAQFYASNGSTRSQFYHTGANYTTSGAITASQGGLYSAATGGLALVAESSNGPIRFSTQNPNTEKGRFSPGGTFMVNTTTEAFASNAVKMLANSAENTALQLNTGTNGGAVFSNGTGAGFEIYSYAGALGSETYTKQLSNDGAARTIALRGGTLSNGVGIAFPAVSVTSTNANTLDDYEEGTWDADFVNASGTPLYVNNGLVRQNNFYVKIGKMVFITAYLINDASFNYNTGITAGTNFYIGGLPFVPNGYHTISCGYFANWNGWTAAYTPMFITEASTSLIRGVYATTNSVSNMIASYMFSATSQIVISGCYYTDS